MNTATIIPMVTSRLCLICKVEKPLTEFHIDRSGTYGRKGRCRGCCNKIGRERDYPKHKRSGMKNRPDKLKRIYGITYEDVVRALEKQRGRCANTACLTPISLTVNGTSRGRAMIDHDHSTGRFRALLCGPCNTMLGLLEKKEHLLLGLGDYIKTHSH